MNAFVLALALLAGENPPQKQNAPKAPNQPTNKPMLPPASGNAGTISGGAGSVAGAWRVEYMEINGAPLQTGGTPITIENNTLILFGVGKEMRTYRMQFKPNHKVEVSITDADKRQKGQDQKDQDQKGQDQKGQTDQPKADQPQNKEATEKGVYIISRDFLCSSIGEGYGSTYGYIGRKEKDSSSSPAKASIVVILRRQGPTIIQSSNVPGAVGTPPATQQPQKPTESVGAVPATPGGAPPGIPTGTGQNGQNNQNNQNNQSGKPAIGSPR